MHKRGVNKIKVLVKSKMKMVVVIGVVNRPERLGVRTDSKMVRHSKCRM